MNNLGKFAVLGALLAASASSAFATPVVAGGATVAPSTTTSALYTGTFLGGGSGNFTATTFSGHFNLAAYSNAPGAPIYIPGCTASSGCIDYVFSFGLDAGSSDSVAVSTVTNYFGYAVDASYVPGSGVAPTSVNESSSGAVNFTFPTVGPGQNSDIFVLYTNSTVPDGGQFSIFGKNSTFNTLSAGPAPALTPEPNSLILLGTGLVGAAGMLMRRRHII